MNMEMTVTGRNLKDKALKPKNGLKKKMDEKPINKLAEKAKAKNPLTKMRKK